ncbi:ABC transporter substrate-binding protein [Actinoalloteichus spitiensis]|uniref:ABC transporter substrate-binding protein n=1 Tax=Actinoalloteichus spitiensis TaxID=252394 RepID=UPI00035DA5BF|nr:ABC transporter substrate-binding protein [Actinoalloteichus spitiensis]
MFVRRRPVAILALSAVAFATGCTTPTSERTDEVRAGDSIVLADVAEPTTLHPLLGYAEQGKGKFYDGLLTHDAERVARPALAVEEPEPSPDGTTWTVRLREDVTFHDGSPFGAEDVVATYRAALDPATGSPAAAALDVVESVTRLDDHTVQFDLRHPHAGFPDLLVLGIVPSEDVTAGPLTDSPLNTQPVGTGPYRLVEWTQGERMVWEANPDYWDGAPEIDQVTVVFGLGVEDRVQGVGDRELDGAVLLPWEARDLPDQTGLEVVHHDSGEFRAVTLPSEHPVAGDPSIRLALNLAVDRAGMVDDVLGGHGQPAYTPFPPTLPEFVEPGATFVHDVPQARRMLENEGWDLDDGDEVRVREGTPARFTLLHPVDDPLSAELAAAFAEAAAEIGVEVGVEELPWTDILPRADRDAVVVSGGNPLDPDFQGYRSLHSSSATGANLGHYANPEVDAALDAARLGLDQAQRTAHYRAAQRAYVADPGLVYLVFPRHSYLLGPGWAGYQRVTEPPDHGMTWGPWWNLEDWTRN